MSLTVRDVRVQYGGRVALDGVSVDVAAGVVTGLVGSNGAGKSTLIGVIGGQITPHAGTVTLDGEPLDGLSPARRARRGLGRSFQKASVFFGLTVRDDVGLAARHTSERRVDTALATFGLTALADRMTETLPLGVRRRVELARCLATAHRYLLLDEPSCNLDEAERAALTDALRRMRTEGVGLLLVDHDMELIDTVCDEVVTLERGRVMTP